MTQQILAVVDAGTQVKSVRDVDGRIGVRGALRADKIDLGCFGFCCDQCGQVVVGIFP